MSLAWTDDEYARLARALDYPAANRTTIVYGGISSLERVTYGLYFRIQEIMTPSVKAAALALADKITAVRARRADAVGETADVEAVGDIRLNLDAADRAYARVIGNLQLELSNLINFPVAPGAQGGSNINRSWST